MDGVVVPMGLVKLTVVIMGSASRVASVIRGSVVVGVCSVVVVVAGNWELASVDWGGDGCDVVVEIIDRLVAVEETSGTDVEGVVSLLVATVVFKDSGTIVDEEETEVDGEDED